jgi:hypothetical protein
MTVFDPDRWRTKTWERLRKDATKSASEIAHARWTADFLAVSSIEKIVAWCNTRCIEVKFTTTESHYDSSTKVISIAASARPQKQLIYLLHECGHHLIGSLESRSYLSIVCHAQRRNLRHGTEVGACQGASS